METALRAIKANKASGSSGVSNDLLNFAGRTSITQITKVFQQIMDSEVCPEKLKDSTTLLIFKPRNGPISVRQVSGLEVA